MRINLCDQRKPQFFSVMQTAESIITRLVNMAAFSKAFIQKKGKKSEKISRSVLI